MREECHGLSLKDSVNVVSLNGGVHAPSLQESIHAPSLQESMHAPSLQESMHDALQKENAHPSSVEDSTNEMHIQIHPSTDNGMDALHPLHDLDVLSSLPLCLLPRDKGFLSSLQSQLEKAFQSTSRLSCSFNELGILPQWKREELRDESLPICPFSPSLYDRSMILAFTDYRMY